MPSPLAPPASRLLVSLLVGLAACGSSGGDDAIDARPRTDGASGVDGAGGSCPARDGERDRAVVLTLNRDAGDTLEVRTLDAGGRLSSTGIVLATPANPRRVVVRDDGREALVAFGAFGIDYGIVRITMEPDGSTAEVAQTLVVGNDRVPFALAYAGHDRAILAMASGPDGHDLIALDRQESGDFMTGPAALIPGNWPLQLLGGPDADRAVLLRVNLAEDTASELMPLARGETGWVSSGASGSVAPPSIAAAWRPSTSTIYSPASDPEHPATLENLNPPGVLHVFTEAAGALTAAPTFALPNDASTIAAGPGLLVLEDPVLEIPPDSDTPNVYSYRLTTVMLDAAGLPTTATTTETPFDALLVEDLAVVSPGLLVTGLILYADRVPIGGTEYPIVVWGADAPGAWEPICDTVYVDGLPTLAVAP